MGSLPPATKSITSLRALVIGINDYESITRLTGAVVDADSIDQYLRVDLQIPPNQIKNLRNKQATRSAIIDALLALRDDPSIDHLDPILIYYAGHGSEVTVPNKRMVEGSKTQCIVPQDVGKLDSKGREICVIPDYTLSALFYDLAAKKGNNITVIFDCCHSASSTRGTSPEAFPVELPSSREPEDLGPKDPSHRRNLGRARYVSPDSLPLVPDHLDSDILTRSGDGTDLLHLSVPGADLKSNRSQERGMHSHVLLAACKSGQKAYEKPKGRGGYFTSALLRILRNHKLDTLTYKDFISSFDWDGLGPEGPQAPVCEGANVTRFFFNAMLPGAHHSFIPATVCSPTQVMLKAGPAQGVMPGSKFSLHAANTLGPDNPSLAIIETDWSFSSPDPTEAFALFYSTPSFDPETSVNFYARSTEPENRSELNVCYSETFEKTLYASLAPLIGPIIAWVDSEDAHVLLDLDTDHNLVTFAIRLPGHDEPCRLPYAIAPDANEVQSVLVAMAEWNWHSTRVLSPQDARPFEKDIEVQFFQLGGTNSDSPSEPDENMNQNGSVNLIASAEQSYGIRIRNKSSRRLFVYPFYFSSVAQSIRPLFLRSYSGDADASFDTSACMTIGCEDDDMPALSFQLNPGVTEDVGRLRLFLTTSSGDFDSMTQPSPFAELGYIGSSEDMFADGVQGVCELSGSQAKKSAAGLAATTDPVEPRAPVEEFKAEPQCTDEAPPNPPLTLEFDPNDPGQVFVPVEPGSWTYTSVGENPVTFELNRELFECPEWDVVDVRINVRLDAV